MPSLTVILFCILSKFMIIISSCKQNMYFCELWVFKLNFTCYKKIVCLASFTYFTNSHVLQNTVTWKWELMWIEQFFFMAHCWVKHHLILTHMRTKGTFIPIFLHFGKCSFHVLYFLPNIYFLDTLEIFISSIFKTMTVPDSAC
jgi:hypothetical protein